MDEKEWGRLLEHSRSLAVGRLQTDGRNHEDAEDAVGEALLRLLNFLRALGMNPMLAMQEERLLAWLTTTARRYALNQARNQHLASTISLEALPVEADLTGEDMAEAVHTHLQFAQAWQQLAETERELLLTLLEPDGGEGAQEASVNAETRRKRLLRARNSLQKALTNAGLGDWFAKPRTRPRRRNNASK